LLLALTYGATFVAQGWAAEPNSLTEILTKAIQHRGFSFVTVVTPCVTFDSENVTYDRLRDQWKAISKEHVAADLFGAMSIAMKEPYTYGIFFQKEAETWDDMEQKSAELAKGKSQKMS